MKFAKEEIDFRFFQMDVLACVITASKFLEEPFHIFADRYTLGGSRFEQEERIQGAVPFGNQLLDTQSSGFFPAYKRIGFHELFRNIFEPDGNNLEGKIVRLRHLIDQI